MEQEVRHVLPVDIERTSMEIIMGTAMPARRRPSGITPILFSRGVPPGAGDCILLSFICIFLSVSLEVRRKKDAALTAAPFQKAWEGGQSILRQSRRQQRQSGKSPPLPVSAKAVIFSIPRWPAG